MEPETTREKRSSLPLMLAVAFGVGFALGVTFVGEPPGEPVADSQPLTSPTVTVPPLPTDVGLSELVDGFTDTVVVVTSPDVGLMSVLSWPWDSAMSARPLALGQNPKFDSSGQIVAFSQSVRGAPGDILTVGRVSNPSVVASDVLGFGWHDRRSGFVAFSRSDGSLWTLFSELEPDLVATELSPGARIVAWGDWGFALETDDGVGQVLDQSGQPVALYDGNLLTSDPRGLLVIQNDGVRLLSVDGPSPSLSGPAAGVEGVRAAAFSPDGSQLALAGDEGVITVPVGGDGPVTQYEVSGSDDLAWSSDGRFLLMSGTRGLWIFDVQRGLRSVVLNQFKVVEVVSIPSAAT